MININKLIGGIAFWFGFLIIINYNIHTPSILSSIMLSILLILNVGLLCWEKKKK